MMILLSILACLFGLAVAVGLVWCVWTLLMRSEDPARVAFKWGVTAGALVLLVYSARTGLVGVAVAVVLGIFLGCMWAPHIAALLASPLTSTIDGGSREVEARPFYSIAEAKRKQGRYPEAIAELEKQLSRFPGDYEGMLMLAEIQAEHLKDPVSAFSTIDAILEHGGHARQQIAYALNRAADWHLKLEQNPALARVRLERIVELCPETEQAQFALQRIAHLASPEMLKERLDPHPIPVKEFEKKVGLQKQFEPVKPVEEEPGVVAANYVKQLNQHPNDNEAREKLALVYAHDYERLDLATEQLELLINAPNQVTKRVVHWLNLLVDLQIKLAGDATLARQTLQRIVDRFPKTAAAENALSRMHFLNLELRTRTKSQVIKLGSYEQNIGLKSRSPTEDAGQSESQSR